MDYPKFHPYKNTKHFIPNGKLVRDTVQSLAQVADSQSRDEHGSAMEPKQKGVDRSLQAFRKGQGDSAEVVDIKKVCLCRSGHGV